MAEGATCLNVICAILLPPVGVRMHKGCAVCDTQVIICVLLSLLAVLSGIIYALFPVGVSMYKGCAICDTQVIICILLTLLAVLPGIIYALYVICSSG